MTKKLLLALSAAALGLSALQASAQATPSTEAKEECFRKHAGLMSKLAVKNPRDCWQTHRHL